MYKTINLSIIAPVALFIADGSGRYGYNKPCFRRTSYFTRATWVCFTSASSYNVTSFGIVGRRGTPYSRPEQGLHSRRKELSVQLSTSSERRCYSSTHISQLTKISSTIESLITKRSPGHFSARQWHHLK
ncbi:hypothetical protein BIW11_11565 [Tropilaelaps mercedesae]|uniref:Uncharacterized protein n=1 Tax=Tropilaelaps mercedesae TaxID=418985 RepID=A0A1V9XAI0_9ACAR|nr:hypothetical protein BIW11_11565 [Tropilaelaps mercedesae]